MLRLLISFLAAVLALGASGFCQIQEPSGLLTSPERAKAADPFSVATGIYSFSDLLACSPDACLNCASELLVTPQA